MQLLLLLLPPALAFQGETRPVFQVHSAGGQTLQAPLRELAKDWSLRLADKDETRIAAGDLVSLRRPALPLPPLPEDAHLILVNGDRVPCDGARLVGERLHFRHPDLAGGKETSLPLSAVSVYWLESPANADDPEKLRRRLVTETRPRDRVLLLNGDVVEGTLNSLDPKKVEVEVARKMVAVDIKQVAAIALSTELADTLKPRGTYAQVVLAGGSRVNGTRLSLSAATSDGATLEGTTLFGAPLKVPLERVAGLDVLQGKAVYLADLKPAKYEFRPYLDWSWPLVADGSVAGKDLRLGNATYTRGLGMHSHSRVTYQLGGAYRRFEALVGLDPRTGRQGSARINVYADGKPVDLGGAADLREGSKPLVVNVDVAGVKELVLETAFGRRGDVQAHVNWVDARLVK
jgi:hypothetical protein